MTNKFNMQHFLDIVVAEKTTPNKKAKIKINEVKIKPITDFTLGYYDKQTATRVLEDIDSSTEDLEEKYMVEFDYDEDDEDDYYGEDYDEDEDEDGEQGPYIRGDFPEQSYWNHNGRFQKESDQLQGLLPRSGKVEGQENSTLEQFRIISNVYYDVYNNGGYENGHGQRHDELARVSNWDVDSTYSTEELEEFVDAITEAAHNEQSQKGALSELTLQSTTVTETEDDIEYTYAPGDQVTVPPEFGGEAQVVAARSNFIMVKLGNNDLKSFKPSDVSPLDAGGISQDYNPDDESMDVDYDDSEPEELMFDSVNEGAFRRREQNAGLDQDPAHPDDVKQRQPNYGRGPSSRDENNRPYSVARKVMVNVDGRPWKSMSRAAAAKAKATIEAKGKKVTLTMEMDEAVLPSDNLPSDNVGGGAGSEAPIPGAQTGVDPTQNAQTGDTNNAGDIQDLLSKLNEPEVADTLKTMMNPDDQPQGMGQQELEGDEMSQLKNLLGMMK